MNLKYKKFVSDTPLHYFYYNLDAYMFQKYPFDYYTNFRIANENPGYFSLLF
jgi:hypothetical protein